MFGFRTNTARQKGHSNHQRSTKPTDVRPQVEIGKLRLEQSGPSFDEAAEDDHFYYHENSSVDMSLYTTQSKSTIHYSSRALINYGNFESDNEDCYSNAQTEFTTEVALNRYFRLGGAWQSPDPLRVTPTPDAGVPVSPSCEFMSPQSKATEQTKELTVSSWSRNSTASDDDDDDDSMNVIYPMDSDCEQTTCSVLPATAKMARLATRGTAATLQEAQKQFNSPLMDSTYSTNARDHCEIENMTPNSLPSSACKNLESAKGPIDLDESVTDSVSMASSSNSCVVSFSGTAPPRIYHQAGNRLLAQVSSLPTPTEGSRHPDSTSKNMKGDGDSSSASSSKLSLHYGTSTPPQKSIQPALVPTSISSGSWRGRSLQSPDEFSVDSFRDDDTYGFSIVSAECEKSVVTPKSGDITPKNLLGELFEQWDDSYESESAKWKPHTTSRHGPPSHDMPLATLYSNAITGSTNFEDHKSSTAKFNKSKATADHQSFDTSRVHPNSNGTHRRPSTSSESNERIIAKPNTVKFPVKSKEEELKDRTSRIDGQPQQQAQGTNNNSVSRGIPSVPHSLSSYPGKTLDRQVRNTSVAAKTDLHQALQTNSSQNRAPTEPKIEILSSRSRNDQNQPSKPSKDTYAPVLRMPPQGVESGNGRSDSSGSKPHTVVVNDDDTFGFSTTSPAPIPELSEVKTLGIRPSPLTRTGGGPPRLHVWADNKVGDKTSHMPSNREKRTCPSTLHPTTGRTSDQGTGALLLTETVLQNHLSKVEETEPHPSTKFEGYDAWKRKQEEKERYFAMLDAKAKHIKPSHHASIDRRQPGNGERSCPRVETRQQTTQQSSLDHAVRPIPRLKDERSTPPSGKGKASRHSVWGWLQSGKKNKAQKVNEKHNDLHSKEKQATEQRPKKTKHEIVPLSHFMRISGDDDSEVMKFSTSPLHKDGILSLGTTTLPDTANTQAATKSHYFRDTELGTRGLISQFTQVEREKQHVAALERRKTRIENNRTVQVLPKPNKNIRSQERSIRSDSPMRQIKPQLPKGGDEGSIGVQTVSVSSKQSVDSSMKSGSGKILSPCVICTSAERTHIAMPCMHYYFCKECVETLDKSECPRCPVCSTNDVVFTRVYTG